MARSAPMRALVAELRRFAATDANVLITGETGTGKDLVAEALHLLGPRRAEPFLAIDCPSLPTPLFEAEIFGHERGAYTDATVSRPGRFELAGGGTVYLDRVHELPLEAQGKLLRLVEQKQVERLGTSVPIPIRARIVASADTGIEAAVRAGTFRSDLYHRLRVLPLRVPPLRDRRADLAPLVGRLVKAAAARHGRRAPEVTPAALAVLAGREWPGNVRELAHALERALLAHDGARLDAGDLPADLLPSPDAVASGLAPDRPTLEDLERRYVAVVLAETSGNQTKAAGILGISRKALWEKRKRYGIG